MAWIWDCSRRALRGLLTCALAAWHAVYSPAAALHCEHSSVPWAFPDVIAIRLSAKSLCRTSRHDHHLLLQDSASATRSHFGAQLREAAGFKMQAGHQIIMQVSSSKGLCTFEFGGGALCTLQACDDDSKSMRSWQARMQPSGHVPRQLPSVATPAPYVTVLAWSDGKCCGRSLMAAVRKRSGRPASAAPQVSWHPAYAGCVRRPAPARGVSLPHPSRPITCIQIKENLLV